MNLDRFKNTTREPEDIDAIQEREAAQADKWLDRETERKEWKNEN